MQQNNMNPDYSNLLIHKLPTRLAFKVNKAKALASSNNKLNIQESTQVIVKT